MALPVFAAAADPGFKPSVPWGARFGYYVAATTPSITEIYRVKAIDGLDDGKVGTIVYSELSSRKKKKTVGAITYDPVKLTCQFDKAEHDALRTIKNNLADPIHADYGKKFWLICQMSKAIGETGTTMIQKFGIAGVLNSVTPSGISDESENVRTYEVTLDPEDITEEFI